ncbi:Protein PHLOEM PROTEIN 2-LIKE A10 [Cardamine amara subsp. amara]|uniref:Protein PHLOEM PROTEIN 2-LIKE A10 n=1 Tax=Cardamine amara subsp. amara TaxID=228776 RepID=A0ABD1B5E4_CARAN
MDLLRLGEKGPLLSQRQRKWLIFMAISGVSGYGAYKVYHLPSIARKRKRLLKIFGAIVSVAELISESAETMSIVSRDLNGFLNSDSDEIPNSLKQIAKITKSNEFTDSLVRVSQALTIGVFRGYNFESSSNNNNVGDSGICKSESSVVDRVIDKVFSKAGTGFVSVVVGSFAKNLVLGFYPHELENCVKCDSDSSETPQWVTLLCDDKCRELLADCIQRFTSTAIAVYLDKTMEINTYDQIFEGLTNPKHQDSVKDVLVSVCNGALETLVRTSHEVFTSPRSNNVVEEVEEDDDFKSNGASRSKVISESGDGINSNGWVEAISSTLAVPSNRRFMFDVTGRVTLETTRSIIGFIMLKTLQGFRKSFNVVHEEVTDKGRQVVGYVGDKASVIITVCLALYLHIISGCVRNSPIGVSQHF